MREAPWLEEKVLPGKQLGTASWPKAGADRRREVALTTAAANG